MKRGAIVLLLTTWMMTTSTMTSYMDVSDGEGFLLDPLDNVSGVVVPETQQCPSNEVITTRFKCQEGNEWVDCVKSHCCPDYLFIAGRCLPKDVDPCSLHLCEQRCAVLLQSVVCTCFTGFTFNRENNKRGIKPVCEDVNECEDNNGDCEHVCVNLIGRYRCECNPGYTLRNDNRSCEPTSLSAENATVLTQAASKDRCYANCDTVLRLHSRVSTLQEKLQALSTAVRLSSLSSGSPGPAGKSGPPGPPGPRGFPGFEGSLTPPGQSDGGGGIDISTYSLLDSYVTHDRSNEGFCRCKRGPLGPPGPTGPEGAKGSAGERGPRGPKGNPGSFDFLLLLLADIRHDIRSLQEKVFIDEEPPPFDLHATLRDHRRKERKRVEKQRRQPQNVVSPTAGKTKWQKGLQEPEEFRDYDLTLLVDYDDEAETSGEVPPELIE